MILSEIENIKIEDTTKCYVCGSSISLEGVDEIYLVDDLIEM